jgi:hypothetical protein
LVSSTNISSVDEGSVQEIVWQVTLDKPTTRAIDFSWVDLGGSATLHDDYDLENATVLAFETTAELKVIIYNDDIVEGDETINLTIESGPSLANKYLVNPSTSYPTANITIKNFESNALTLEFDWERGIEYAGVTYGACANIDLDVYIADAAGFDINNPFAGIYGDFQAATGACPETFVISLDSYPDGEYILFHDLWDNGFAGLGTDVSVPITTTFYRGGVFDATTLMQDASQVMNSDDAASNGVVAMVTIENGVFTVSDFNGNVVGSGKTVTDKAKRPNLGKTHRTSGLIN